MTFICWPWGADSGKGSRPLGARRSKQGDPLIIRGRDVEKRNEISSVVVFEGGASDTGCNPRYAWGSPRLERLKN